MQGHSVSSEDLIDVLTLKDKDGEEVADFDTALQIYDRQQDIPASRKESALRTIWRRVYLYDTWDSLANTSNMSDEELKNRLRATAVYKTIQGAIQDGTYCYSIFFSQQYLSNFSNTVMGQTSR
jgi:nuclear pore complex protein Nup133